ncbi:histone-lysine N-methyltransferase ATXR3-like isoform X2 [Aristolochia californica]|uniref:histone-lysine N-methyltransferase ATXR3-like isoform X2 n=1 Tax=Aristolochia californica TaxID=171875 RepID=UPI0035E23491
MGDGGVACVPSQHLMDRFPISETFCGGNGGFGSKTLQFVDLSRMPEKKMELEEEESCSGKTHESDFDKGEIIARKPLKIEVEKGEIVSETVQTCEIENGEIVLDKPRKWEIENGEIVPESWQKSELEKGEYIPDKWQRGQEKGEILGGRGRKVEPEKGEFVPDRSRRSEVGRVLKGEVMKEEFGSGKGRKWELEKGEILPEKGRKDRERSSGGDFPLSKKNPLSSSRWDPTSEAEFSRSGTERRKRSSSRWDPVHDKETKSSSRADEELGAYKTDHIHKYHGDYNDRSGSKVRRISDDNNRMSYSDKLRLRSLADRSYRNSSTSSSSSRVPSSFRYSSSRHHDLPYSSKGPHDRHGRSPSNSERSPYDRARHHDHKERSPDLSSYERVQHNGHRDRSPGYVQRSPHDKGRRRDRTPGYTERSPHDRGRRHDQRDRSPGCPERSPHDRSHHRDHHDRTPQRSPCLRGQTTSRKSGGSERRHSRHEEKSGQRDLGGKDSNRNSAARLANGSSNCRDSKVENRPYKDKELENPNDVCSEIPQVSEAPEDLASMEEDMDICDTPPHVPNLADSTLGKWFYLDHYGTEQGPSKLCDLRQLVEEGFLQSDHLIKHSESDRWVTVENAVSPLVSVNFPSIFSDTVTQLVNPPEAPGNLMVDSGDVMSPPSECKHGDDAVEPGYMADFQIDERVGILMMNHPLVTGNELEVVGDALGATFEHVEWEKWDSCEGFTRFQYSGQPETFVHSREKELTRVFEAMPKETAEARYAIPIEKEYPFLNVDTSDWCASLWSFKGGDWKRNDEAAQDKTLRKKLVLNEGYPLCQVSKSSYEDPRWSRKDDLYSTSRSKKLDLPVWAFSCPDEKNEANGSVRPNQLKPVAARGVKGTMLPVVRINVCVVRDHGPVVSESRTKSRANDHYSSSRSIRSSAGTDGNSSSTDGGLSRTKKVQEHDGTQALLKCRSVVKTPKDRVCKIDDLELNLGDWHYLDGAGHEHGPSSFLEFQALAEKGVIPMQSSVFRKTDNLWVPVTSMTTSKAVIVQEGKGGTAAATSSSSFHSFHPQFIGYTRGKVHELVMKSYKSREFAAAINEVLDPWIVTKQPKKGSALNIQDSAGQRNWKSDEVVEDLQTGLKRDLLFEDLCGEAVFDQENNLDTNAQSETESWGLLNGLILARVFHCLRTDFKSLAFSAATCKSWNRAVKFYRGISRHVDFSPLGSQCTDTMFRNFMKDYNKAKLTCIILTGCNDISAGALEEVLHSYPSISSVDVIGCSQFRELYSSFKNVEWTKRHVLQNVKPVEESYSKIRSLKQLTDRNYSASKAYNGGGSFGQDFNYSKASESYTFQQSSYKRRKLLAARKAPALLSREAQIRQLLRRKKERGYKRIEEFLAVTLKDIMKENTFELFVPKVGEIENRMRNGYYLTHGLRSVRDDISRICREALKARTKGDTGEEINRIIMLFLELAASLEESSKASNHGRDEMMKSLKDTPVTVLSSAAAKYKKKHNKVMSERKGTRSTYANGGVDRGEYATEREIRRRLNKLNKKALDSESETSDDLGPSEEDIRADGESTNSDTESDHDLHAGSTAGDLTGNGLSFIEDEGFDSVADEREWGARMTKASLVPPVTRKYEVIDHYVIVTDEEEVQRKMRVSLPDDYAEKLKAQKNSSEEADMDFPEVKEYKPRKKLGDEVLEQEVYGIDPYTHNLLLDSMPEESPEWPLSEKHLFIEETLLRALNKQTRPFTGGGNTPMTYPLQPVIKEIQSEAEVGGDTRIMKMCDCILKAMQTRPDDNYVAYRKGLGVVCNKEEGFIEDDFVVEFLGEVYPAWKWFEKQDGIRSMQKNNKDPAPEFYNIYLERPKGDRDGYDLVVVDAMHKANYASRICHSCRPNCEAKVTAVDGQYQIGIYALRPIGNGEEITFDYNSVTESKEEYEASVCLCGSQVCRGSYLNLTGEGAFQKVLKDSHGILDRHQLLLEACELNSVSEEDLADLGRAGLSTCLLSGLPDWLIAYSARLVRFINFERTKLPDEILNYNLEEKRKFFTDISLEVEKSEAEIQAEGVCNQRLQNLALTLDKVRYVMRCVFGDPKLAPPPLEKLSPEALVSVLWKGEGSLIEDLLQCMVPHMEDDISNELRTKIHAHDPTGSGDLQRELRKSLLWLRDEIRNLPCSYKCRNDAAADLIHLYAYTKCFFKVRDYEIVTSGPVYISPLDLGPKYTDKMGTGFQEYYKTYGESYCLGKLIYWYDQTHPDPDRVLARSRRGCLTLPDIASFYAKIQKPPGERVYGPGTVRFMLAIMEKQPYRPWPKDRIWQFKSFPRVLGSPMMDAVLRKSPLDKEMVHWLKSRKPVYQAMWDR